MIRRNGVHHEVSRNTIIAILVAGFVVLVLVIATIICTVMYYQQKRSFRNALMQKRERHGKEGEEQKRVRQNAEAQLDWEGAQLTRHDATTQAAQEMRMPDPSQPAHPEWEPEVRY